MEDVFCPFCGGINIGWDDMVLGYYYCYDCEHTYTVHNFWK